MKLDDIAQNFAERLTDIALYQRAATESARKELEGLNNYAAQLKENSSLEEFSYSMHAMHYYDPATGTSRRYGFRKSSTEDRIRQVILQKNRQYCWLLAEAYEEFEDFIEAIYAYIGKEDNASWLMSDFGNISLSELRDKDYQWYLQRAKNKRDVPQSILSRLRFLYPEIADVEANNKLNINLKFTIEVIEKLRHIIVHKGGKVEKKHIFVENLLKSSGLWNNGKFEKKYKHFIEKFFGSNEFENAVLLLEIRIHPQLPLDIHLDLYAELSGYLIAEATLICQSILDKKHGSS